MKLLVQLACLMIIVLFFWGLISIGGGGGQIMEFFLNVLGRIAFPKG